MELGEWDSAKKNSRDGKELFEAEPNNTPRKRTARHCRLFPILLTLSTCRSECGPHSYDSPDGRPYPTAQFRKIRVRNGKPAF